QPAEHDWNCGLEAREHVADRLTVVCDGIADACVGHLLDRRGDEPDFAGAELFYLLHLRREETDALDVIGGVGSHHPNALTFLQHAVDDAHQHYDAEIDVIPGV